MALSSTRRTTDRASGTADVSAGRCRRRFLRFFSRGFQDKKYFDWERDYKLAAHERWQEVLNPRNFRQLLKSQEFTAIATAATRIESRTNLLFSFEKMAFRDAVRQAAGAELFATGLYDLLYGRGSEAAKFEKWCEVIAELPRKQTRVLTHPVVTVFPFIADPDRHIFLKPNVTKAAAAAYGSTSDTTRVRHGKCTVRCWHSRAGSKPISPICIRGT